MPCTPLAGRTLCGLGLITRSLLGLAPDLSPTFDSVRGSRTSRHIHTRRDLMRRALLIFRVPNRSWNHAAQRLYSTPLPPQTRTRHPVRTTLLLASAISGAAVLGLYSDARSCTSPPFKLAETTSRPEHDVSPPLLTLFRTYFVYGLTSCETIVDHAPEILDALLKVPLVGTVVEGVVRRTFFNQVRTPHPICMPTN